MIFAAITALPVSTVYRRSRFSDMSPVANAQVLFPIAYA